MGLLGRVGAVALFEADRSSGVRLSARSALLLGFIVLALAPGVAAAASPPLYQFRLAIGGPGSGDGQLRAPTGVAPDGHGDVYVVDYFVHQVSLFSTAGRGGYVIPIGGFGSGNGKFNSPWGAAYDASTQRLYVTDAGNQRVEIFGPSGGY